MPLFLYMCLGRNVPEYCVLPSFTSLLSSIESSLLFGFTEVSTPTPPSPWVFFITMGVVDCSESLTSGVYGTFNPLHLTPSLPLLLTDSEVGERHRPPDEKGDGDGIGLINGLFDLGSQPMCWISFQSYSTCEFYSPNSLSDVGVSTCRCQEKRVLRLCAQMW